jgi:glycosyltransferase involved in cell wall biosynthesis
MLHCELLPLMPGWVERSLLPRPYIYDFDDAFYLKYRSGKLGVMRPFLGGKFDAVIAGAAAVTAGNNTLADYARGKNTNTHLLPTVVDTERYMPASRPRNDIFTVGWIGSPSTAPYLTELVGPLSLIGKESPVRLVVIGGKAPSIPNVAVEEIEWSEQTEVVLINTFDVGVMPLPDDDWARGKCAFKLIQYMACAVPVVASRVGANIDVVQTDCGFLATGEREWVDALRFIRDQPLARRQMGKAGRLRVGQHYSLHRNLPILADIIRKTVEKKQ